MWNSEKDGKWREPEFTARVRPAKEDGNRSRPQVFRRRTSKAPRPPVPSIRRDFFRDVDRTGIGRHLNWEDFRHSEFTWPELEHPAALRASTVKEDKHSLSGYGSPSGFPRKLSESAAQLQYPPPMVFAVNMVAMHIAVFCVALDNTIIPTTIPRISGEFHSLADVGWYGSGESISSGTKSAAAAAPKTDWSRQRIS
jgi:hypothetical protein